jgi:hypothetical protein
VRVLDRDVELAAALVAVLRQGGVEACRSSHRRDPDVLVVGLPAPEGLSPRLACDSPVVLLDGDARFGEPEAWLIGRPAWRLLSKPLRGADLLDAVRSVWEDARARRARMSEPTARSEPLQELPAEAAGAGHGSGR